PDRTRWCSRPASSSPRLLLRGLPTGLPRRLWPSRSQGSGVSCFGSPGLKMAAEKGWIGAHDADVGFDAEIDPVPHQVAVMIDRSERVALPRIGFVVAPPGADGADAAGAAAELAAVLRLFYEGRELRDLDAGVDIAVG